MVPADEQLMAAYADGDITAFEALYERHKGRILGYLFNRLRDRDEAEEVFQIVFAKLHAARDRYREDIPFLPWIFTIARNALIDHVRKNRTYQKQMVLIDVGKIDDPDPRAAHGLSINDAISGISSLTPIQRRALELRFDQDFSFDEIADHLQTSVGNARQMVSRAVRHLRRMRTGGRDK
jgi:RNA polymerase sigma factor (sigma-70 family)